MEYILLCADYECEGTDSRIGVAYPHQPLRGDVVHFQTTSVVLVYFILVCLWIQRDMACAILSCLCQIA